MRTLNPCHPRTGIEESKNVKHSYDDLEEEVKVRKNELEILSAEKTKSELTVRKYKNLLDSAKATLNGVVAQITSSVDESEKKSASDEKS